MRSTSSTRGDYSRDYSTSLQYRGSPAATSAGPADPHLGGRRLLDLTAVPVELGTTLPSALAPYCGTKYASPAANVALQETPGPNNYPFDPDYAC